LLLSCADVVWDELDVLLGDEHHVLVELRVRQTLAGCLAGWATRDFDLKKFI
jgi:hypothetical protein